MWGLLFYLVSFRSAAQSKKPEQILGSSVAASGEDVFLLDKINRHVLRKRPGDQRFTLFAADNRFKAPLGLAVGRDSVFVTDPKAHAIFRINSTGQVTQLEPMDASQIPTGLAVQESRSFLEPELWLFFVDNADGCLHSLALNGSEIISSQSDCTVGLPKSVVLLGSQLVVASQTADGLSFLDASKLQISNSSQNAFRQGNVGVRGASFFAHVSFPEVLAAANGVLFVGDYRGVYALINADPKRALPVAYSQTRNLGVQSIAFTSRKMYLTTGDGALKAWPRLAPIVLKVENHNNANEALAKIYRYLFDEGLLATTTVQLPYAFTLPNQKTGTCSSLTCVARARRLLLSGWVPDFDVVACKLNAHVCRITTTEPLKTEWQVLPNGVSLRIPLVPTESYLGVISRDLDGSRTVRTEIEDQFNRSDEQLGPWNDLITDDLLSALNPSFTQEHILETYVRASNFKLPAVSNKYYMFVSAKEISDENSRFWRVIRQINKKNRMITVASLEERGTNQGSIMTEPANELHAAQNPATSLTTEEQKINSNMKLSTAFSVATSVSSTPILVFEDHPSCNHPAFFEKTPPHQSAFDESQCTFENKSWSHVRTTSLPTTYHSTCIASLLGAKYLPYASNLLSRAFTLTTVPKNTADLDTAIGNALFQKGSHRAVINISQDDPSPENWEHLLSTSEWQRDFFVVAAGNHARPIAKEDEAYPAILTRKFSNAVSVAALNYDGDDLWWEPQNSNLGSNYGHEIDLAAPGENVPCATHVENDKAFYGLTKGTSMAAALVSIVAAELLDRNLTAEEVKGRLLATSDRFFAKHGRVLGGSLNVDAALRDVDRVYLRFDEGGRPTEVDADLVPEKHNLVILNNDSEGDSVPLLAVKRIERTTPSDSDARYRVVYRKNAGGSTNVWVVREDQRVEGCVFYKVAGTIYRVQFENCTESPPGNRQFENKTGFRDYTGPAVIPSSVAKIEPE